MELFLEDATPDRIRALRRAMVRANEWYERAGTSGGFAPRGLDTSPVIDGQNGTLSADFSGTGYAGSRFVVLAFVPEGSGQVWYGAFMLPSERANWQLLPWTTNTVAHETTGLPRLAQGYAAGLLFQGKVPELLAQAAQ